MEEGTIVITVATAIMTAAMNVAATMIRATSAGMIAVRMIRAIAAIATMATETTEAG